MLCQQEYSQGFVTGSALKHIDIDTSVPAGSRGVGWGNSRPERKGNTSAREKLSSSLPLIPRRFPLSSQRTPQQCSLHSSQLLPRFRQSLIGKEGDGPITVQAEPSSLCQKDSGRLVPFPVLN